MNKKLVGKIIFVALGAVLPIAIGLLFACFDLGALFNSWENGKASPDWRYTLLVLFKLSIYIFPPLLGMLGFYLSDKTTYKHKFWFYLIKALNIHFLVLLCIKLLADSIFEVDKIWGLTIFESIKDVQTLIGYVVTLLIKQNIKIEPGFTEPKNPHGTKELTED